MRHKRVLPRRLRIGANPGPRWIITVPQDSTRESVEEIAEAWVQAARDGTLVVTDNIKVEQAGRR